MGFCLTVCVLTVLTFSFLGHRCSFLLPMEKKNLMSSTGTELESYEEAKRKDSVISDVLHIGFGEGFTSDAFPDTTPHIYRVLGPTLGVRWMWTSRDWVRKSTQCIQQYMWLSKYTIV